MKSLLVVAMALLTIAACKSSSRKQSATKGSDAGSGSAATVAHRDAAQKSTIDSGDRLIPEHQIPEHLLIPEHLIPEHQIPEHQLSDQQAFQARIQAVAKSSGTEVAAWGTMAIFVAAPGTADDCQAKPTAEIAARRHTIGNAATLIAGDRQHVSYVFETADHKLLAVTYEIDGRTQLALPIKFDQHSIPLPSWTISPANALHHSQTHRGGYEFADLMISANKFVIAKHELLDDGREKQQPTIKDFALDGGCYCKPCPELSAEPSIRASLEVTLAGPSAAADFLSAKAH